MNRRWIGMNVERLEVGRTYKSYKELCEVLGIEVKTSNSKKAQIKEMERYFNFSNGNGHKLIVNQIYNVPLPPSNNITSYAPMIERLLLHILVTQSDSNNRLYIRKNQLLELLNMINKRYGQMKWKQLQLMKEYNIPRDTIVDFYTTSDDTMKRNIEAALKSLKNQSLIQWSYVFSVCKLDTSAERNYEDDLLIEVGESFNEYGDIVKNYNLNSVKIYKEHREATDEETKAILRYQRQVLKEYGLTSLDEVFKIGKAGEFYKKVYKKLQDNYNIEFYYDSLSIIFNHDHVTETYNTIEHFIIEDGVRELLESNVNSEIINKLISNAHNRHMKALDGKGKYLEVRSGDNFIDDNMTLCNNFIRNRFE